jgi:uncharacterized protein (TIGR00251 family)
MTASYNTGLASDSVDPLKPAFRITSSSAGATFSVRVIPRARKTGIGGMRDGVLVVRLAAPPVDGAANAALVTYLAELLDCPKRDVAIVAGQASREKRLAVSGMTAAELTKKLSDILPA